MSVRSIHNVEGTTIFILIRSAWGRNIYTPLTVAPNFFIENCGQLNGIGTCTTYKKVTCK